jgi:hypothetical protein
VVADALGNVFASGSTQGSLGAPIGPVTNVYDAFVAKYDGAGNLHWTQQFNLNAAEYTEGLAADNLGNVYIAGRTSTPGTNFHAFINKYDGSGTLEWTRQLGTGPPTTNAWGLSADGQGNAYMVGSTGASLAEPNLGGSDVFVTKYDTSGNLIWTHQFGSDNEDYAYAIAADGAGNLYIGGHGILDGTGPTRDFLARYVIPEPASGLLVAVAAAIFVIRKRRSRTILLALAAVFAILSVPYRLGHKLKSWRAGQLRLRAFTTVHRLVWGHLRSTLGRLRAWLGRESN